MIYNLNYDSFVRLINHTLPGATAFVKGKAAYPSVNGVVNFYASPMGVVVVANINNLPPADTNIFAFHIHEGSECSGNEADPFANTGLHYNPKDLPHPKHAGDLPPLFSNNGYAWMAVLSNRFKVEDVLGKTVVVHLQPDDFVSQPSGNAGEKIACGVIKKV